MRTTRKGRLPSPTSTSRKTRRNSTGWFASPASAVSPSLSKAARSSSASAGREGCSSRRRARRRSALARDLRLTAHRRTAPPDATSTAHLIPRKRSAPAARGSSLGDLGLPTVCRGCFGVMRRWGWGHEPRLCRRGFGHGAWQRAGRGGYQRRRAGRGRGCDRSVAGSGSGVWPWDRAGS